MRNHCAKKRGGGKGGQTLRKVGIWLEKSVKFSLICIPLVVNVSRVGVPRNIVVLEILDK